MYANRLALAVFAIICAVTFVPQAIHGQAGGNRIGAKGPGQINMEEHDFSALMVRDPKFIQVTGAAEIRVQPTEIRLVLAAVSEGKTANECKAASRDLVGRITSDLIAQGINEENGNKSRQWSKR